MKTLSLLALLLTSTSAFAVPAAKFQVVCATGTSLDDGGNTDNMTSELNKKIAALGNVVTVSAPSYANGGSQSLDDRGGTGGYYYPVVCVTVQLQ